MSKVLLLLAQYRNMSHFSAWLGLVLAVNMNKSIVYFEHFLKALVFGFPSLIFTSNDIDHDGWQKIAGIAQGIVKDNPP